MKRTIELTDPRSLRALAHPTRLALVGLLREHGTLTATQAGRLLGLNSGSCSFHLRQLAKYGLVEEVEAPGRQKPWRATAQSTSWPSVTAEPEVSAAVRLLNGVVIERYAEFMREWLDRREHEPLAWQEAVWFGDRLLVVTAEELSALGQRMRELVAPYEQRLLDPVGRPAGARRVLLLEVAMPREDMSSGESRGGEAPDGNGDLG